jgi:uncharacterized protein YcnI
LIFGKASGWAMNTDLGDVDASFVGETALDGSGRSVAIVGDVNDDGYDDFVIGASGNDTGSANAWCCCWRVLGPLFGGRR